LKLDTIGANIRKCRLSKKMRQEDLAEKANLSVTYVGMIERGEKTPSLETLVAILNAIDVSADVVLCDVVTAGYTVKNSLLNEKLSQLSEEDRNKIYDVIDTMISHSKRSTK
jgi:transcriptional regulator with XRE-family HTH domain